MTEPERPPTAAGRWRANTLLGQLAPAVRREMLQLGVGRRYAAGTVLLEEGASHRQALLLLEGYVKINTQADGAQILLGVRAEGDLVGDLAALSGRPRSATVTACTPILARYILPETLRDFTARHRPVAELINAMMVEQLVLANRHRVEFATRPLPQRLARVILHLADVCGRDLVGGAVQLPAWFSQGDLANLVGVSEDSVQRVLRSLRQQQVVDTSYRSITILDVDRLTWFAQHG